MDIIPAIDLREGTCVRVFGNTTPAEIYTDDPVEQAVLLAQMGATKIHITDLDAAFSGHLCNLRVIQEMAKLPNISLQLSGGVRSLADIATLDGLGVEYIVVGVRFLGNKDLLKEAYAKYGERIIPGVDARDGLVAIEGYELSLSKTVSMLLDEIGSLNISKILYTDLRRYGSMQGPNFQGIEDLVEESRLDVMVAGGVSDYASLLRLKEIGVAGAVIGKAIYAGNIELQRAMELAAKANK